MSGFLQNLARRAAGLPPEIPLLRPSLPAGEFPGAPKRAQSEVMRMPAARAAPPPAPVVPAAKPVPPATPAETSPTRGAASPAKHPESAVPTVKPKTSEAPLEIGNSRLSPPPPTREENRHPAPVEKFGTPAPVPIPQPASERTGPAQLPPRIDFPVPSIASQSLEHLKYDLPSKATFEDQDWHSQQSQPSTVTESEISEDTLPSARSRETFPKTKPQASPEPRVLQSAVSENVVRNVEDGSDSSGAVLHEKSQAQAPLMSRSTVEVRIGTIEVRVQAPPSVPLIPPASAPAGGFDDYEGLRIYSGGAQ